MIYSEKDPKTGKETQNDLSVLPYVSIPKDTLMMMTELLKPDEIGNVVCDVVNELYCNCQYDKVRKTNTEEVFFNLIIDNIGRLSSGYFKKIKNLNNQNKDKE